MFRSKTPPIRAPGGPEFWDAVDALGKEKDPTDDDI
jgi:hypothetical protein